MQTISKLDLAWEAVNALGGSPDASDPSFNDAIASALEEIEKLGGKDPAPARAKGAVEIGDGGPAFPSPGSVPCGMPVSVSWHSLTNVTTVPAVHHPGMSLRDWFAGQIMVARAGMYSSLTADLGARMAYMLADAMLAARAK